MKCGFKCFNQNMVNRYGMQFEVGNTYFVNGTIKFGNDGNGFHFCKNLEDTLRYFDTSKEIVICKVRGLGKTLVYNDEYNGYYDMYVSKRIFIEEKMTRKDIIEYALNLNDIRVERFLMFYPLSEEEKKLFKEKFKDYSNVLDAITYYQEKDLDVYKRRLII